MLRDPHRKKKIIAVLWLDTESWVADTSRNFSELFQDIEPLLSLAASNFAKFFTQKTISNAAEKTTVMDEASTNSLQSKQIGRSPECSATFLGMFGDIPRNVWGHSPECLATFPRMFGNIPRNVWQYSPECLTTFHRNVWGHSPECLATFPGMFDDIPRNVWVHCPEYLATFPEI